VPGFVFAYLVVADARDVGNPRNVPGGRRRTRAAGTGLPRVFATWDQECRY
jgi:hypothetical protein